MRAKNCKAAAEDELTGKLFKSVGRRTVEYQRTAVIASLCKSKGGMTQRKELYVLVLSISAWNKSMSGYKWTKFLKWLKD